MFALCIIIAQKKEIKHGKVDKGGQRMRLFIAITLSKEMKKTLVTYMHDLKKQGVEGRFVPAQNLHMTMAFIGEYENPDKVKRVIEQIPMPPFRLTLSEQGRFGNLLWIGVKGNQKLKSYNKNLREALKQNNIPFDHADFVPHITLVRKFSAKKPYQVTLPKAEMIVEKVSLMKTEMKDGKVRYREL